MKLKPSLIVISLLFILILIVSCDRRQNKGSNENIIRGLIYNEVIEKGLKQDGASVDDLLYEELLDENKIILYTAHNAIGVGYMDKTNEGWMWSRITPFYDFKSISQPMPSYMAGGTEFETPDGKRCFLAMGKIFNLNITKLTLYDDQINAVIQENDGNRFWFKLLKDSNLNKNIKAYNDYGQLIE